MTVTYNPFILTQIAGGYSFAGKTVGIVLLYNAPATTPTTPSSTPSLLALPGFQEVSTVASPTYVAYPGASTQKVMTDSILDATNHPGLHTVQFPTDWLPIPTGGSAQMVYVASVLFYIVGTVGTVVNPWVMMTTDPVNDVVSPGAKITNATRSLFSYLVTGGVTTPTDTTLSQVPGTLTWESARIQHVYLLPQRTNFIPNPSFEDVGNFGWRSDGAITRNTGGVDSPTNHYLSTVGTVMESIPIPAAPGFHFSAWVRKHTGSAATKVNLGLTMLDASYAWLSVHWAQPVGSEWPIYGTWTRYDGYIVGSDDAPAVVPRIQADGPFDCDLVLLEATTGLNPYYDGDSQLSVPGDFSWQGPVAQSYSFWYNNRYQTAARIFGEYKTGQVTKMPGLIYDWIPTGTTIMTHWDVLSSTDTKHPLENWTAALYNRVTGYDLSSPTFTPSGSPTTAQFNYAAGSAAVQGTVVSAPAGSLSITLSTLTVGNYAAVGVNKSNGLLAVQSNNQTSYDAAYGFFATALATVAQAYVIQRVGSTNTPADFVIYNVRQP